MKLTAKELRVLFDAVVSTSGHIDPMGFMARILITSEADPNYVDVEGRVGLLPIRPDEAAEFVGASDVYSVEGNIISALAIDMKLYETYKRIDKMVLFFHSGLMSDSVSLEAKEILDSLDEARVEVRNYLFPPLATTKDVIDRLTKTPEKLDPDHAAFFKTLLRRAK